MSCQRKVKYFDEVRVVKIEVCDRSELQELIKSIESAITQKLEKLNILIKNCDIYCSGGHILVNDRFNICSSLKEVAEAFGIECKELECSLKGKTYVLSDKLVRVLKQLGVDYNYGSNIANREADTLILSILASHKYSDVDPEILAMVKNIMKNGKYTTTEKRQVTEIVNEERFNPSYSHVVERRAGEWVSNVEEVRNKLLQLSRDTQKIIKETNAYLRDGTTKLIYTRARQMGYAVQEVKKGTQTQLVLVRYE